MGGLYLVGGTEAADAWAALAAFPASLTAPPSLWLRRFTGRLRGGSAGGDMKAHGEGDLPVAILDAVSDAVLIVDADDRVRTANQAVETVLGYKPEALVGTGLAGTLLPPRYRDAHRARLRQYAETGQGGSLGPSVRLPVLRADGTEMAAELSVQPASRSGRVLFGVCIRDVEAAQAAGAELAAARNAAEGRQRMLRTIVDALPDPVVAVDRSGRVVFRNQASVRSLAARSNGSGAAPEPGANDGLSAHEWHDADAVMRSGMPAADQEEPDAEGGVRLTTRVPVQDGAGEIVGLVAISRDVTAQKAAEAQLLVDKEAAEAAARANSEVLATTSHEIRTLMSGVTGMTALLLDTDLDDEQRDFVETVRTSSNALLAVVNDVLDLSKIDAGMLELEERSFSVRQVVKEALSMVAQQGAAKGLHLSSTVADDVPDTVRGDDTRVRQVLANLLSNAIKFTEEGSVRVRVGLAPTTAGAPALEFAVEDTGVGIAPDRLEAVFEWFAQADASTARTHGGTGLGLAICRRLVQMMGGEMSADSVPGEGSVFRFTVAAGVPAADRPEDALPEARVPTLDRELLAVEAPAVDAPAPEAPEADAPPAEQPRPDRAVVLTTDAILPSARVLIAEDDPVMQKVASLTLRRLGYRPDVAADGAKAVMAVRNHVYDVVLMDVMMPVMDGLEATRQIRTDPGPHPAPAIVALTANAMKGDRQKCLDAGCDDYLAKPVAPRILAAVIERAVRSRAGAPVEA